MKMTTNVPSWSETEKKTRQEALDEWAKAVIASVREEETFKKGESVDITLFTIINKEE